MARVISANPRKVALRLQARFTPSEAGRRAVAAQRAKQTIRPAKLTRKQWERATRNRQLYAVTRGLDLDCAMRVVRPG